MEWLKHDYFKDAMWICEELGLLPLMQIKEDYNVELVHQFFATLVFGNKPELDFQWMSGGRKHKSTLSSLLNF